MPAATARAPAKPHQRTSRYANPGPHSLASAKPKLYNPHHPERTVAGHFESWPGFYSAGQFDRQFDGQGESHTLHFA